MISWIVAGEEIQLDDRDNGKYLLAHSGLGMSPFHRMEDRGVFQHGVTDKGFRLDPRFINLVLGIRGDTLDDFYEKRADLVRILKPSNREGILRWKLGDKVRQINGYLIDGLQFSDNDRGYLFQRSPVTIKCPDPTWYDPAGKAYDFGIGGGSDTLEIPLVIPMTVGGSSIDFSQQIIYGGTFETFPVITIIGPVTNLIIEHQPTGDTLDFTGYTISGDDTFVIDLRYGYKTVKDQNGINHIDKLTNDSDLATFRILPHPDVPGGSNSIRVKGTGVSFDTKINIQYLERFIGV